MGADAELELKLDKHDDGTVTITDGKNTVTVDPATIHMLSAWLRSVENAPDDSAQ